MILHIRYGNVVCRGIQKRLPRYDVRDEFECHRKTGSCPSPIQAKRAIRFSLASHIVFVKGMPGSPMKEVDVSFFMSCA